MLKPHGGTLVDRLLKGEERERVAQEAARLPSLELTPELAWEAMNMATGVLNPLEGFMGREDFETVLSRGRLADGLPWTIPIVLDISQDEAKKVGQKVVLSLRGDPFALFEVHEVYTYEKEAFARAVFGTTDLLHPGIRRVRSLKELLVGGTGSGLQGPAERVLQV